MAPKPINIAESFSSAVADVTKDWAKQRKAEERDRNRIYRRRDALVHVYHISIKEAAWDVMDEAYAKASDDGRLPVRPRQIMYPARGPILELIDKDRLDDRYFTQTILPDYVTAHPDKCASWDIVWDARGHFTEPHTGHEFGIGTSEVREYLGLRAKRGDAVTVDRSVLYPTSGPEHRYNTILFIEKEGFGPLLAAERIAERYDLAIMSTKGMSVTAARLLLDRLVERGVVRILVLHDFDISGFSILGTLATSSRRYVFENDVEIIDLGLRLADVEAMGLEDERVSIDKNWFKVAGTLRRHGATPAEIDFLRNARVELNAMTSPQFIEFVEGKLAEHGVRKLVPDEATLIEHARRRIKQRLAAAEVEKLDSKWSQAATDTPLRPNLRLAVEKWLAKEPELSWEAALDELLARPWITRPTK